MAKKPIKDFEKTKQLSAALAIKLGSVLVHVEEMLSPKGHTFDEEALRGLLQDAEVREWLGHFPDVMLPLKR